jgi:hypothetical protein
LDREDFGLQPAKQLPWVWFDHRTDVPRWISLGIAQIVVAGQRPTPELKPDFEKLSRALLPQKELVTRAVLNSIIQEIIADARLIEQFRERLYRVLPLDQFKYAPLNYSRRRRRKKKSHLPREL